MRRAAVVGAALLAGGGIVWLCRSGAQAPPDLRAARRAYEGAPPVIPHPQMGSPCIACHTGQAIEVKEMGVAPAMPHRLTTGLGPASNCRQCHVFGEGVTRDGPVSPVRRGERAHPGAPPMIPHPLFMREDCAACHTGPAARAEIRCTHPERARCTQCHLPVRP